jgi:hypothetical protein
MRQSLCQAILYKDDGEAVRLEEPLPGERTISMLAVSCLGLFLVASWVVVYGGAGIVSQVATDYSLQVPESPYFQVAHAELLYGWLPLVIMGSLMLLLSPGIFLVLGLGSARHWSELIILAFGTSFLVHFFWSCALFLDIYCQTHLRDSPKS